MKTKEADSQDLEASLNKLDKLYSELKIRFEDNLRRIKNTTNEFRSSIVINSEPKKTIRGNELEQDLIDDVEVQEITDQQQFAEDRQKNLVELDKALSNIHNMSQKIYEITMEDDLKINSIMKQQKEHKENVETRLLVDINRTAVANTEMRKKTIFFGFIAVLLAFGITGIYFMTKQSK